jgi:hypothetical protein
VKRFIVMLFAVLALSLVVSAQTLTPVQKAMSDFGLIGHDCQVGTDVYVFSNGVVYETMPIRGGIRTYIHTEAHLLDSTLLSVTVTISDNFKSNLNGVVETLIYLKHPDGRFQTVSNIRADGTVIVKNGIVVDGGTTTPSWGICQ